MNMRLKWDDMRYFLAAARTGRISQACRTLKVDHSTVSRKIRDLEVALGQELFEKSPAGYKLTEEGRRLLPAAENIERAFESIAEEVSNSSAELRGVVRVGAPDGVAAIYFSPKLASFSAQHPKLSIEVLSAPQWISLSKRDADIAISLSRPETGRQKALKLTDFTMREYIRKDRLAERSDVPLLGYINDLYYDESLEKIDSFAGTGLTGFSCSTALAQYHAIAAGQCRGVMADFVASQSNDLVPCEPEEEPLVQSLWIRFHEDLAELSRIRNTVDFLVKACRSDRAFFLPKG